MNGVQTRLKCKPNVKRCKRFVFAAHSPLLHPNTLKTKAIIHFQTDHILTRFVFPPLLKAEKKIADRGVRVTTGRVIAEQTLGFWNSFYETHHYALLAGVPCRIFKKLPPGFGRKEINDIIVQVRELRNRINHNEPICFVNRKCDFSYVKGMYTIISDFLTWIDPEIMPSLKEVDKVCKIIEKEENKQKQ